MNNALAARESIGKVYANDKTKQFYTVINTKEKDNDVWYVLQGMDGAVIEVKRWTFFDYRLAKIVQCPVCHGYGTLKTESEHITDKTISQGVIIKRTTTTTSTCYKCNGVGHFYE